MPEPRLNYIQVIGSHNSYKKSIEPSLMNLMIAEDSSRFSALNYNHISVFNQLEMGIRKLELDLYHDPQGGRYHRPWGIQLLLDNDLQPLPYDSLNRMHQPGFKVFHVQDVDFRTHCYTLKDCLSEIVNWSNDHPNHLPLTISFNTKVESFENPKMVRPLPFTQRAFDSLEAEVVTIIPRSRIITPDDIRGNHKTLKEAIHNQSWPYLSDSRGKFLFVIDESPEQYANYVQGHPNLEKRLFFVNAPAGSDLGAFIIMNDPIVYQDSIKELVQQGYLVRTRADADTQEARKKDYTRFQAALRSGAHFISTDYYLPDGALGNGYHIILENRGFFQWNPILYADYAKFPLTE